MRSSEVLRTRTFWSCPWKYSDTPLLGIETITDVAQSSGYAKERSTKADAPSRNGETRIFIQLSILWSIH